MITKTESLKSNHLELPKIERKQLSIQFSLDGFSFCVFDLDLQEYILFNSYEFKIKKKTPETLLKQIKQIFKQEEILFETFEKVLVVHVNNLSTFVPFPLFDEDHLDTYVKFNNKIYQTDYFVYDLILSQDMVSVFVPYVNINNFLIDQFGSFEYKHFATILVETLLNNYANREISKCFIHIAKSHFEIIIGTQKKLLFYNTFEYKTTEDFLYYILFTLEQLNLNVEEVALELLGEINVESNLFIYLYKYVRNIKILSFRPTFNSVLNITKEVQKTHFCLFNTIDK